MSHLKWNFKKPRATQTPQPPLDRYWKKREEEEFSMRLLYPPLDNKWPNNHERRSRLVKPILFSLVLGEPPTCWLCGGKHRGFGGQCVLWRNEVTRMFFFAHSSSQCMHQDGRKRLVPGLSHPLLLHICSPHLPTKWPSSWEGSKALDSRYLVRLPASWVVLCPIVQQTKLVCTQGTVCWLSTVVMSAEHPTMKWSGWLVPAWECSDSIWQNLAFQPQPKDTLLQMRNQTQRSECHPKSGRPEPDIMQIGKNTNTFGLIFLSSFISWWVP